MSNTGDGFLIQVPFNGVVAGLPTALLAVAFQSVYLPTSIFFLALGGIYVLVPYITLSVLGIGWPPPAAIFAGLFVAVLCSVGCEYFNHARLAARHASSEVQFISSLGLYVALVQLITLIWGNSPQILRRSLETTLLFGSSLTVTRPQAAIVIIGSLALVGLACLLRYSTIGLRLRALADNPTQFSLLGLNKQRHRLAAFALSGIFCSVSSLLTSYDAGFDPSVGLHRLLLAIVAVIIGGRRSYAGPILGGVVIGLIRSYTTFYSSARWQEPATFGLLVIFLLFKPEGILGARSRIETKSA